MQDSSRALSRVLPCFRVSGLLSPGSTMLGTEKLNTQWLRYPRPGGLRPLGLSTSDHIHLAIHPHDSDTVCKSPWKCWCCLYSICGRALRVQHAGTLTLDGPFEMAEGHGSTCKTCIPGTLKVVCHSGRVFYCGFNSTPHLSLSTSDNGPCRQWPTRTGKRVL